ncbi:MULTISPECIES: TetR/AcrR family transcriptional regulator [unclassified Mesorhizobium]|uniref:TetR/AcrR family transcriptional regulator n=1 Tax=unclassified Mesorhizobium TaxID=325217 RepID=UPI00046767AA|nr:MULTISPECIES: TetR/AcrR family transcriptional regulator [unclassified Mesorhizobium]
MARFQTAKKAPPPLPAELRDAAIALFAEFGYAATGIREIARRTGLSSAAMYHYLRSKQDLLFELMYDSMQDQFTVARAALESAQDPEGRVTALARSHVLLTASRRLETLVTENEVRSLTGENRQEITALRDEYAGLWRVAIADGVAQGIFGVADVKLASFAAIEMCTSVSRWYSPHGPLTPEEISQTYAEFVLDMLRGDGRAGSSINTTVNQQKRKAGKRARAKPLAD